MTRFHSVEAALRGGWEIVIRPYRDGEVEIRARDGGGFQVWRLHRSTVEIEVAGQRFHALPPDTGERR